MAPGRLLAALVFCSVALTSCGSSSTPSSSSIASGSGSAPIQAVQFAHCMRSNGVTNYPDPSSGGRPQSLNQIDPNSSTFATAYATCRKYARNGEIGPPAPSVVQLRFALAFAQCMRKNGFPQFPDPLATAPTPAQGTFTLGKGEYFPILHPLDITAAFRRAAKTCGVQLP
jgi:hypothetical protein